LRLKSNFKLHLVFRKRLRPSVGNGGMPLDRKQSKRGKPLPVGLFLASEWLAAVAGGGTDGPMAASWLEFEGSAALI
jgi:hypothetical protein